MPATYMLRVNVCAFEGEEGCASQIRPDTVLELEYHSSAAALIWTAQCLVTGIKAAQANILSHGHGSYAGQHSESQALELCRPTFQVTGTGAVQANILSYRHWRCADQHAVTGIGAVQTNILIGKHWRCAGQYGLAQEGEGPQQQPWAKSRAIASSAATQAALSVTRAPAAARNRGLSCRCCQGCSSIPQGLAQAEALPDAGA